MLYFRKLLEAIGLLSFIIIISSVFLIYEITKENIVGTKDYYDAIIVLSGNPERASRASKLYFKKKSRVIFLSKEQATYKNYFDPNDSKSTYKLYSDILVKNGVEPRNIVLYVVNNKSTIDEAR